VSDCEVSKADALTPALSQRAKGIPSAAVRPQRRISFVWIIPLLALALAGWLSWRAWMMRGLGVMISLPDGHGL
jgi:paraquat-inducible protein B